MAGLSPAGLQPYRPLPETAGLHRHDSRKRRRCPDLIYRYKPDLVLLDIMLPGIDGYEVCENIRLNPNYRNVKIIFLTAKGREEDIAKGLALGANSYITKPFSNAELLAKVKELLETTYEDARE